MPRVPCAKKIFPGGNDVLESGDVLVVQASRDQLLDLDDHPGVGFGSLDSLAADYLTDERVKLALGPACLRVYSPGHYRFSDYVRAGIPLTIIAFIVLLLLVPLIWPLAVATP